MAIRWDKLTVKAQEAVQRANDIASEHGNPELQPVHILAALLEDHEGIVAPLLERVGLPGSGRPDAGDVGDRAPAQSFGRRRGPGVAVHAANQLLENAFKEASNFKDEFVSTEHLLLAMTKLKKDSAQEILSKAGRHLRQHSARADRGSRQSEGHRPESRGQVPGAGALRSRPDGTGAEGQARSRDRTRRRSASRGAGAVAPHQEQSSADWRARRGQDCHRRRTGAAHYLRRRARAVEEQARGLARPGRYAGGREVPRRVRRPAQGRAERDRAVARGRSFCSSTSCTRWWAPERPRARLTPPTC